MASRLVKTGSVAIEEVRRGRKLWKVGSFIVEEWGSVC